MKKYILSIALFLFAFTGNSQSKEDVAQYQKKNSLSKEATTKGGETRVGGSKLADKVKKIVKIFEPISRMHLPTGNTGGNNGSATQPLPKGNSNPYNADGSANWGQQYNTKYGCYLDALRGRIVDAGEAADLPETIDLIFAAYKSTGAYYLFTPNFAHAEVMADAVWGSATTDNPVKSWKAVNETEVAETILTAADFNAIQNNNQLSSAAAKAKNWAGYVQLMNRFDNKVFALRVHTDSRKLFALIYVQEHMGTDGGNGYLKIRIKVTGIDTNNDGEPDSEAYETR
jgi:hypothetical protein